MIRGSVAAVSRTTPPVSPSLRVPYATRSPSLEADVAALGDQLRVGSTGLKVSDAVRPRKTNPFRWRSVRCSSRA